MEGDRLCLLWAATLVWCGSPADTVQMLRGHKPMRMLDCIRACLPIEDLGLLILALGLVIEISWLDPEVPLVL